MSDTPIYWYICTSSTYEQGVFFLSSSEMMSHGVEARIQAHEACISRKAEHLWKVTQSAHTERLDITERETVNENT